MFASAVPLQFTQSVSYPVLMEFPIQDIQLGSPVLGSVPGGQTGNIKPDKSTFDDKGVQYINAD